MCGSRRVRSLINVEDLSVRYGANTVLRDVGLTVEPDQIVTIAGPNGSGKISLFGPSLARPGRLRDELR